MFLGESFIRKLKWRQKSFKNLVLNAICCLLCKSSMVSGRKHESSRQHWKQNFFFFFFVSCQRCWSINCFDRNTFIYITGLYCVSINSLPVLPMTVCFISMFSAATLLLRWNCPEGLLSISILGYMQPSQSWELHAGVPGTSGCLYCW